jgi:hypothetical protein
MVVSLFAFSPSFLQDNSALVCSFTEWYQQSGKISHDKMSFLQSGDETGSASFVLAFRQQINPLARNQIDENRAEPAPSFAREVVDTQEDTVKPRAWGNFMIRRQRVIEEVVMPRQAASRAPRLPDVDRPRAVRV